MAEDMNQESNKELLWRLGIAFLMGTSITLTIIGLIVALHR